MFQESEPGKQKFVCFVCGIHKESMKDFQDHIIESHEEGSDYIICPLERCKMPVRCVKSHYKTKHPGEKIPEKGMLKATIWRDVSSKGIKKQKPKFRQGWYESTKMKKSFFYRSGYENIVFQCLDELHCVNSYDVEPFEIPYIHQGKAHKYTPDIIVSYVDGRKEIIEIKPASQTLMQKNQDKWYACQEACKARGWDFVVITEQGINKLKNAVANQKTGIIWD